MDIPKIHKGWKELQEEVIDAGKCLLCGACAAFCDNISFDLEREVPVEDGLCTDTATCRDGYGTCYNLCPQTGQDLIPVHLLDLWVFGEPREGRVLGHTRQLVSAKAGKAVAIPQASAGGAVTALLLAAKEMGLIDCALTTGVTETGQPEGRICTTPDEIVASSGTKPHQCPNVALVGEAVSRDFYDIGFVGTPCQVQALRKMQNHPRFDFETYDLVSLAIGTFCFGTYRRDKFQEVLGKHGITLDAVTGPPTFDDFKVHVPTKSGPVSIPESELFATAVRANCKSCSDYTAEFADIAAGMIGSAEGWTTLIVRTPVGERLLAWAVAHDYLETRALPVDERDILLTLGRAKTDMVPIESIVTHASDFKSFVFRDERIAKAYKPGQFVVLWVPGEDYLPMSISRVAGETIEVTVQAVGPGTRALFALKEGDGVGIRGPFGHGWQTVDAQNILVVGGGIGIAALTTVVEDLLATGKNVYVALGARDADSLLFQSRLTELVPPACCTFTTDDGSVGQKCFVTDAIEDVIVDHDVDLVLTCGPELMMKRVFDLAEARGVAIQASLERFMKCGVGLCGSCCVGEDHDVPVCKDGPVFHAAQLRRFPAFGTYSK